MPLHFKYVPAAALCMLSLLLIACGNGGTAYGSGSHSGFYSIGSPSTGEFNRTVVLSNLNSRPAKFRLSIKGFLFSTKEELLEYISSMPEVYPGEPPYEKAWRFMTLRSYAHVPYTGSTRVHDPLLYINSLGYGYCDDVAFVLETVWRWQGFESRVWGLEGHVVPEIKVGDRWMMYDPDFGVFYRDISGEVTSVEQLASSPELITNPVKPILALSSTAYSDLIASFYSTAYDNRVDELGVMDAHLQTFTLPQGSSLVFPVKSDSMAFAYGGETRANPLYYLSQLKIPDVTDDTVLELPLFVVGISGAGEIEMEGHRYLLGSVELKDWFARFVRDGNYAEPVTSVKVFKGATQVVVDMSMNPFIIDGQLDAELEVHQESREPFSVVWARSDHSIPSPFAELLTEISARSADPNYTYTSPVETGTILQGISF